MAHFLRDYSFVVENIEIFEKNKKFNWEILNKIGTIHLKNPKYLRDKINKDFLSLTDINYITKYQRGMIHFELSGNLYIKDNEIIFTVNKEKSNWDFNSNRPNTEISFNYRKKDRKNIQGFWHLHPWNSMNIKDRDNINITNFFSIEDIDGVFTYPKHLFVIFNMESPNKLKYPCAYILMFHPELIDFESNPTYWQRAITGYQRVLVPFLYEKIKNHDDKIDWEDIKNTFLSLGIMFEYLYDYNNNDFLEKVNIVTNQQELPDYL